MTMQPSPDLLDLAEAVAAGTLRADDAERQLRLALGPDHAVESEQAVRELRGLIGAAGAVRAHARATREALGSASPDLAATVAYTPASIATLVPGRVTGGAVHPRSSNSGDGAGRAPRRTWLLAAAALLLVGGAMAAGSGLVKLPSLVPPAPAPSLAVAPTPNATASPSEFASPLATLSPTPVPVRAPSWTVTGIMTAARLGGTATLLPDGRVLVAGGIRGTTDQGVAHAIGTAELYDPRTGSWTATGTMRTPRQGHTATLLPDGKVLVAGGLGGLGSDARGLAALASAELYDPSTGSWTATGAMGVRRLACHGHAAARRQRLVAGGDISAGWGEDVPSAELYDPSTGVWAATGSMGTARGRHTATLLPDGTVLVAGGGSASAELYDPRTRTWSATGSMGTARGSHTATLLPDGKVLVAGGVKPGCCTLASAELYEPRTRTWSATGSMSTARGSHTATLLSNGEVLVAGGADNAASVELYDPGSGTWTAAPSMVTAGDVQTATLLPDGTVLVVTGPILETVVPTSAELYDPGSR